MQRKKLTYIRYIIVLFIMAVAVLFPHNVHAVSKGFVTTNGKTYYIKSDGSKQKGWLTLNGKKYYFDKKTGVQQKGWMTDSKGRKRYFTSKAGVMVTGWIQNSKGQKRYFSKKNGFMVTGWLKLGEKTYYFYNPSGVMATGWVKDKNGNYRYFSKSTGIMAEGWIQDSDGNKRYFASSSGIMFTGFQQIDGSTYYFYSGSGIMATGWVENNKGEKRYFSKDIGKMLTGIQSIDGKKYQFDNNGILIKNIESSSPSTPQPSSSKTIRNYLLGALQPVGHALYVWGGGWNDSTRKGVSPLWQQWYDSQSSSYDYHSCNDLSIENRAKGLDCSGFVGWAAYQVMQKQSNIGYDYTVVAEEVGSYYQSLGWGKILSQSDLSKNNWALKPGDVGYNSGHTWIVLGQCSDKSIVIVHSTPNAGCQISGSCTPDGDYDSEAVSIARQYMSKYSGYKKYNYHVSAGNYVRNGKYLRWNDSILSDPDGFKNKTAAQILQNLYS